MAALRAGHPPPALNSLVMDFERDASGAGAAPAACGLFRPGHNCERVARAARAALLIDGEVYFRTFARAALRARRSIVILGWDFHSATRLHLGMRGIPDLLGDFLNFLVLRRRELKIYILTWDYPLVFARGRESAPVYNLGWHPHRRVVFRYDDGYPVGAALHQKVVVVDGAMAFCGGIDLTCGRWDTSEHRADDERRHNHGERAPYAPVHDATLAVDSDAARALHQLVSDRWVKATGKTLPTPDLRADPWPVELTPTFTNVAVAVARTVPQLGAESAVVEVENLYLDMIASAKRYIYLENQYFTARRLGAALAARLMEPDGPEVIAVLRLSTNGLFEAPTMGTLRTALLRKLRDADRHGRFQAYFPRLPNLPAEQCCDLHTKLMIVDDEWLRVGSANFANRSMGVDTECDLVIEARGEARTRRAIAAARNQLLGEHLDAPPEVVREAIRTFRSIGAAIDSLKSNYQRTLKPFENLEAPAPALLAVAGVADPERSVQMDSRVGDFAAAANAPSTAFARAQWLSMAALLAALALFWHFSPLTSLADADRVIDWAHALAGSPWVPMLVLVAYTPAAFILFPRPVITLFAVVAFGPVPGLAYSFGGIMISAAVTYFVGRRLDPSLVRRIAGRGLGRLSRFLYHRGALAMAAVRFIPLAPFAVVNVVAGAMGIRAGPYLLGTALGILPGALVTTLFGEELVSDLRDPRSTGIWLCVAAAVVLAASAWAVRRWVRVSRLEELAGSSPRLAD